MKHLVLFLLAGAILALYSCQDDFTGLTDDFADEQVELRGGDYWTALSPMPFAVEGASVASIGNNVYVGLGYTNDPNALGDSRRMRVYDIDKDTWTFASMAPMGYQSAEGSGVAHGGKFYSVGGRSPLGGGKELLMYDPATDTWTVLSPMTHGRQGLAAVVVGDYIYAIDGRSNGGPFSGGAMAWVEKYDIANDTWTTVASLPGPRSDLAAAKMGNKIYVFGGYDDNNVLNDVLMYNPNTDSWSTGYAPIPTLRGALYAVGTKGNEVFVIGGWDYVYPFSMTVGSKVEAYKVSKDRWRTGASMITGRAETGAASHGGRIYVIGGGQPGFGNPISACEVYKP